MADYKQLCAELLQALEGEGYANWPGGPDGNPLIESARAALAESEPEGPTDEEIIAFWADHCAGDGDAGIIRLARWGRPAPEPPADGEVAELVAWLREEAESAAHDDAPIAAAKLARAVDLLERLALPATLTLKPSPELIEAFKAALPGRIECLSPPQPVPGASHTRYEFSVYDEEYEEQAGGSAPTYVEALGYGQRYLAQYQQDGPHTLELRRVEVLDPNALPQPH